MIQGGGTGTAFRRRRGITVTSAAASGITRYRDAVLVDMPAGGSYYRLAEPSGTTMTDLKGNNNGTYNGAVTLGATSAISDTGDAALSLPGASTAYGLCKAGRIVSGLANWSIEAWAKRNGATAGGGTIYCERPAAGTNIVRVNIGAPAGGGGSNLQLAYQDDAGTTNQGGGSVNVADNVFHHLVITKAATAVLFYVDGAVDGAGMTLTATNAFTNASPQSTIGRDVADSTQSVALIADEVALYPNVTLSPAQVAAHYAAR